MHVFVRLRVCMCSQRPMAYVLSLAVTPDDQTTIKPDGVTTVHPDAIDWAKSMLRCPPSLISSVSFFCNLTLLDQYGNPAANATVIPMLAYTFVPEITKNILKVTYHGLGTFLIELEVWTFRAATNGTMYVYNVSDGSANSAKAQMQLGCANISAAASVWACSATTLLPNTIISCYVILYDANGNGFCTNGDPVQLSSDQVMFTPGFDPVSRKFVFQLLWGTPGSYLVQLKYANVALATSINFTVLAQPAVAALSDVSCVPNPCVAVAGEFLA